MKAIDHPSCWLDKRVIDILREKALEAESLKHLHPAQLEMIYKQRWLKMFVPKELGGLELSFPEILKTEEALAWADGSTAWVVTLCAGAAWFVGFLDSSIAKEAFGIDHVCFAGSGAPTGTAEISPEGYLLNGNWKYASGSLHATAFTANCVIQKSGKPLVDEEGKPVVRAFLMKQHEVTVHKTWNSMGMIATGSHSFEVLNLNVSKNRSFQIDAKNTVLTNPIFRYPFLQLAETTLAINLSGLAVRFIDLCEEMILQKKNGKTSGSIRAVQQAKAKLDKQRNQFYKEVSKSWNSCVKKKTIPKTELANVSKASHALAKQSRQAVDHLYPHCGLTAADTSQEINRVWRNFHTASQHSLFKL